MEILVLLALILAIVVIGITYFSLILGELVPKRLALHAPEVIATRVALPMRWLATATLPFVKLLTLSTEGLLRLLGVREEVKQTVTEAEIEGLMKMSVSLARLREVVERTVELPEEEAGAYHTLGGLVMARLGRIPHAGDEFTFAGLRFEVMDMDRQRVDKVLIQALPEQRSDDLSRNEPDPG